MVRRHLCFGPSSLYCLRNMLANKSPFQLIRFYFEVFLECYFYAFYSVNS
jgi:hypothetical protein